MTDELNTSDTCNVDLHLNYSDLNTDNDSCINTIEHLNEYQSVERS